MNNAKPMSSDREADVEKEEHACQATAKPTSRIEVHTHTQTNWGQMETRGQICFIYGRIGY